MICIVLKSPDGTKSIGLSTDGTTTRDGVTCLPGFLGSVSPLAHRANISRASGCLPEPIEWGFDLIDWTGLVRRSVGILDGSAQLVGWSADIYSDTTVILGTSAFEVVGAVASDGLIQVSCRERWIGNRQTVGFGVRSDRVGLVAGGALVSVKTIDLPKPEPIPRIDLAGDGTWHSGVPGAPLGTAVIETRATKKDDFGGDQAWVWFRCAGYTEWYRLRELINSRGSEIVASGSKFATPIRQQYGYYAWASYTGGIYSIGVRVTADFVASEDIGNIGIFFRSSSAPIVGGAGSLLGWINGDRIVDPMADVTLSDFVVSASPLHITADGFTSLTRIDCTVSWDDPSTPPGSRVSYSGNVANIPGSGDSLPGWDSYNSTDLSQTGVPSTVTAWGNFDSVTLGQIDLCLRLSADSSNLEGFDGLIVDVRARSIWRNTGGPCNATTFFPWIASPIDVALNSGSEVTTEIPLLGSSANIKSQRFNDIASINSSALSGIVIRSLNASNAYANVQIGNIHLYGVSSLSFGSSYAVVQPGASPWWTSPRMPTQAAKDLLDAIGGSFASSAPSLAVSASSWGRYFDPSTTLFDAAKEIANEFWFFLGRGTNGTTAGEEGEILAHPSFTLGDRTDVVTEIVIEYDEWAGTYRRKAYIAHVDEAYDSTNQSRYFGGWDDDGAETGYGLAIWSACRKAWQIHGVQASETFQAPSIHSPGAIGRLWTSSYNGKSRAQWLALQSRYLTLQISETAPEWWAGNSVRIPTTVSDWSGYDLADVSSQYLICTEKTWDPMTLTTTFEVALPPISDIGTQRRIMQTLDATNRITQRLDATTRIIQVQE